MKAFVTLITQDSYLPGTLVLNQSLLHVKSKYPLVAMITTSVSDKVRQILETEGIKLRQINRLGPSPGSSSHILQDKRFEDTWTKLRVFELEEYERVLLLDSDMLIRKNMDELLEDFALADDWIAACHACTCNPRNLRHYPSDWKPENCAYTPLITKDRVPAPVTWTPEGPRTYGLLNSGTVLLNPSATLAERLYNLLSKPELINSFIFPDQDLLAEYFRGKWKPLPYIYNGLKTLRHIHSPLWRDADVKCIHYILADKPWMQPKGSGGEYEVVNGWWWDTFVEVKKRLSSADLEIVEGFVAH